LLCPPLHYTLTHRENGFLLSREEHGAGA